MLLDLERVYGLRMFCIIKIESRTAHPGLLGWARVAVPAYWKYQRRSAAGGCLVGTVRARASWLTCSEFMARWPTWRALTSAYFSQRSARFAFLRALPRAWPGCCAPFSFLAIMYLPRIWRFCHYTFYNILKKRETQDTARC